MVFKAKIDPETRAYIQFASQLKGVRMDEIMKKCNISRASLYCILKKDKTKAKAKKKTIRRLRKLSARDERLLLRNIPILRKEGHFTVKRVMYATGTNPKTVSCRTVQRLLRTKGFQFKNMGSRWRSKPK